MDPEPSGLLAALQIVFIILYSLLSAAESAAQELTLSRRRGADDGDERSAALLSRAERLTQAPSGLRVGMQVMSMSAGAIAVWAYALPLAGQAAGPWGWAQDRPGLTAVLFSLLALLLTAVVFQLFGILLPRKLAARKPRRTAGALFPLASLVNGLFRPAALLISKLSGLVLGLFSPDLLTPSEEVTEDEIRMLVDVGEEKGAIEEAEREMIKNVFEFNNMTAAECMTHRTDVYAIWTEDTKDEIVQLIMDTGLSRFPVYEEDLDHIIGTVSTREYLLNLQRDEPLPLRGILREAHFVPETVRTDVLFRNMQRNKFHMAIVVDEYGGTSGLITMEDLLEEIVGNIYDEYDPQDQQDFEQLGEGSWRVSGTLDVETFNELSGRDLPLDEDYDTIGGYLLSQLSSIPEDGSTVELDSAGLHFEVESIQGRRIEWVKVSVNDDV
ncbi:MAG TPA: hemolysin family protein [Candidatus Limnocylindria bacterium]|nr:hemolysin family protein [Candidatus Limnocylindria bacterium]